MSKKSFIDSIKVASPCNERWEEMRGNDRVRFCSHCSKNVNDLSTMTRKEATRLVRSSDGNICIKYIVDPITRRPIYSEQLLQITRRAPGIAAGFMTASLVVSTGAYAQSEKPNDKLPSATIERSLNGVERMPDTTLSQIRVTVLDPNGAVIPGATLRLSGGEKREGISDDEGAFIFDDLPPGTYEIEVTAPSFKKLILQNINAVAGATATLAAPLEIGQVSVTMGVVGMSMSEYKSALSKAITDEDKDVIRDLISKGEDVNVKETSYDTITPMFLAVETGDLEIVQMLLDAGAKVNARSTSKETPLMRIDSDGTRALVELLIRNGAKVNLSDNDGNTPLILAAENSTDDAIAALIEAGADVNAANNDGETALIKAADRGDIQSVRALLFAGASVNAKDKDGENAWDKTSDPEIEALLVSFGSEVHEVTPRESPTPTPEPTPPI